MNRVQLINQILSKKSVLCVGLDTDINKLPDCLPRSADGMYQFNRKIIEATLDYSVAYKINTAFYETLGADGFEVLRKTLECIPATHFTIADAKRGDIGNTSRYYAQAFLNEFNFDSITVAPYMGRDSIEPFLQFGGKWAIILALTSNIGAADFELQPLANGKYLFEEVMQRSSEWGTPDNTMFVFGATQSSFLFEARKRFPEHFFLVPGVGAQGGTVSEVMQNGKTDFGGLLINASRQIIYATSDETFADSAAEQAVMLQKEMSVFF